MKSFLLHILFTQSILLVCLNGYATQVDSNCDSFKPASISPSINIATPKGFVEVCQKDAMLCKKLTSGYPPSVTTIGYFVQPQEWEKFKQGKHKGFTKYLIAQIAEGVPASQFPQLKKMIQDKQGKLADNTDLPSQIRSKGKVSLGVVDEGTDFITFGQIDKQSKTEPHLQDILLGALNIAIKINDRVLTNYVFENITETTSPESLKKLARDWISCLRKSN